MFLLILGLLLMLAIYGPSLWVRHVMRRHSGELSGMPGTGGELAEHLVERFELEGVKVTKGAPGEDYYSPDDKVVSLSPDHYDGRSVTAVAIAAHEVGHAVQFCRDEPVSHLRKKYMKRAMLIRRIGTLVMMSIPLVMAVARSPFLMAILGLVGVVTMLVSVLMYVAVLPEEIDASFGKAMPILEEGYLPDEHLPAARSVLKAAAYTYVAGALAEVLNLWRWFRYLR